MELESTQKFIIPKSGLFVIVGPSKPDINFSLIVHELPDPRLNNLNSNIKILFDNVSSKTLKCTYFKNLCNRDDLAIFIYVPSVTYIPSAIKKRIDYWLVTNLDNSYIGIPPLNQMTAWAETVVKKKSTIAVFQFNETHPPKIWHYAQQEEKQAPVVVTVKPEIQPAVKVNDFNELQNGLKNTTAIIERLGFQISAIERSLAELHSKINKLQETVIDGLYE